MKFLDERYREAAAKLAVMFEEHFGAREGGFVFASAPGRVELAGNHTDHQGGRVISGAIDKRICAWAAPNDRKEIRLVMEGFGEACIDVSDAVCLQPVAEERGTSASLARGMAAEFVAAGGVLGGFDAVTCSTIPAGGGLSSSAAFEMLMGVCLDALFAPADARVFSDPVELALAGARVERTYFGKLCGAQDQIASACGNAVAMDFSQNPPLVEVSGFDARSCAYALCLIDSHCDHTPYNDEYDAVPGDMYEVARFFGYEQLGEMDAEEYAMRLGEAREALGDRKALRALHYFQETKRVAQQRYALDRGDFEAFLTHARLSGASSAQFLANVSPRTDGTGSYQPAMVILALCAHLLGDCGAWRIHGGGFGGSVLAFVPRDDAAEFASRMNGYLGYDACTLVQVSDQGAFAREVSLA